MGLMSKLFRQHDEAPLQPVESPAHEACFHTAATPEWDNLDDMGKEDRIARYRCSACQEVFSRDDYHRVQREEAERLAQAMQPGAPEDADA